MENKQEKPTAAQGVISLIIVAISIGVLIYSLSVLF
jgi:hypothetical protein